MTTITSNKTGGVVLTSAYYTTPVVVDPGVTISDRNGNGISANSGSWTVVNSGSISGSVPGGTHIRGDGVRFNAGGSVTNAASALISGDVAGVVIYGAAGTVVNSGTITGLRIEGIYLSAGGSVTNAASASITGGDYGVYILGAGTVVNSGTIAGTSTAGIGVYLGSGGTVTNAGTITGSGGTAVSFLGTASNRLVVDPGAVFNGKVIGSTSASNALELASGGGTGTLTGLGTSFTNFGTVTVDSGASWRLTGANTIGAGSSLTDNGTLTDAGSITGGITVTSGGTFTVASGGAITNGGSAAVYGVGGPGTVVNSGSIGETGTAGIGILLSAGGTVTNAGTITGLGGTAVYFGGTASNRLVVDPGAVFGGKVSGSTSASNTLELASGSTGTLTGLGTSFTGLGTSFTNFGTLTVDSGAAWTLTGTASGRVIDSGTLSGGITLGSGSTLTIVSGGAITNGGTAAVYGGVATVVNSGSIAATGGIGVDLRYGVVTNAASASITGGGGGFSGNAIYIQTGSVVNSGNIGNVDVQQGSITNAAGASITDISELNRNGDIGYVVVDNSGTIKQDVLLLGLLSQVDNSGIIMGFVGLAKGGSVTNAASGSITGKVEIEGYAGGADDVVTNYGTMGTVLINGSDRSMDVLNGSSASIGNVTLEHAHNVASVNNAGAMGAVRFQDDGGFRLTNVAGGTITTSAVGSYNKAVDVYRPAYGYVGGSDRIVNSGVIAATGTNGIGISLSGGSLDSVTVTNAGTITGSGGTAVSFAGTVGNRLVVDPGAVFNGKVIGSTSATNTLELAAGGSAGTLSGLGTSFVNFGSVVVDGGASWQLTGANTIASGGTLTNSGTLTLSGATLTDSGSLVNNGGIVLDPSTLSVASLTGSGTVTFDSGSTLEITGTTMPTNTIDGFGAGDTIDLAAIGFDSAAGHADIVGHQLQVTENGHTYDLTFDPTQSFTGEFFHLAKDSAGTGTAITETSQACYCRGTLIATARGEVPIEDLVIGDEVMTCVGLARPIRWIGRRTYSGRFAMGQKHILPIRITAGALADNVPRRDLLISPHHAMYFKDEHLGAVLIEARDLVNGVSIVQAERIDKVEYFHIELDSHDVILAEGAPSESFIDDDSRGLFHNADEYGALYPDAPQLPTRYCAPRLDQGYAVEAARQRIHARAELEPASDETAPELRGLRR